MSPRMLYRHEGAGAFRALGTGTILQVDIGGGPGPDPDPDPEPQAPATIAHGSEIGATSLAAEQSIGAQGTLAPWTGATTFTAAMGPVVIENALIEGNVRVRSGANVTLRNCKIVGPPGSTNYAVRINEGGNARLLLEDCTIICRSVAGVTTGGAMNVVGWGDVSLALRRCVLRGGIDGLHFHGKGPAIWATGDPDIPLATLLVEESWLGDNERLPGSHSDLFQMAGKAPNYVTNFVFQRNRFMGYSLEEGADALTNRADPATSGMASAGFMNSTGGASLIALRANWWEGGNNVVEGGNVLDPSLCWITDNLFAPRANFNAATRVGDWNNHNNRWAASGTLNNGTQVVGGQLISGSTA